MKPKHLMDSHRKEVDLLGRAGKEKSEKLTLAHSNKATPNASSSLDPVTNPLSLFGNTHPDSMVYLQKIQQSILSKQEILSDFFADSMIIFKPKSVISGDFYWFTKIRGKLVFAIGDCCSRGLEGASMTVVLNSFLNDLVHAEGRISPSDILSGLSKKLRTFLQKEKSHKLSTEGIELAVCVYDPINRTLEFEGANRPLLWLHDRNFKVINGTPQPITGSLLAADPHYKSTLLKLYKGDKLYLFTDGFLNQPGGSENTKMQNAQFHKVLRMIQPLKLAQQKRILESFFEDWRAENEQWDDMLLLGIGV